VSTLQAEPQDGKRRKSLTTNEYEVFNRASKEASDDCTETKADPAQVKHETKEGQNGSRAKEEPSTSYVDGFLC
jgi:hypothetical protein